MRFVLLMPFRFYCSIFRNTNIAAIFFVFFRATSFLLEETKQYLIRFLLMLLLEIYENQVIKHNHRLLVKPKYYTKENFRVM